MFPRAAAGPEPPLGPCPALGPSFGFSRSVSGFRHGPVTPGARAPFVGSEPAGFPPRCSGLPSDQRAAAAAAMGCRQPVVTAAHLQAPCWTAAPCNSSDRAGEEFLRCIADNKPLPDYLKRNFSCSMDEVFKTKESNLRSQKLVSRKKSRRRSLSRGRSHCRSVYRTRSTSRSRSRSQESRCRSKSRRRSRSRSCSRKKGRVRSSRSKSRSKDEAKQTSHRRSSTSSSASLVLEKLMQVMSRKGSGEQPPAPKGTLQAAGGGATVTRVQQDDDEESDRTVLPHDRVSSDFSWLQGIRKENSSSHTDDRFDEELFLYGNGLSQAEVQNQPEDSTRHRDEAPTKSFNSALESQQLLPRPSALTATQGRWDGEQTTELVKTRVAEHLEKTEEQKEPSACSLTALENMKALQAPTALLARIQATKEKQLKREGTSQMSEDQKTSADRRRRRKALMGRMDSLSKDIHQLHNQDGLGFLVPVVGFYCQRCEEFIGDLDSVDNHVLVHHSSDGDASNRRGHADTHSLHRDSRETQSCRTNCVLEHRSPEQRLSVKGEETPRRLLITVTCGPPGNHSRPEEDRSTPGAAQAPGSAQRECRESSDSGEDTQDKSGTSKSNKKKKKKKKKKEKKKRKDRS